MRTVLALLVLVVLAASLAVAATTLGIETTVIAPEEPVIVEESPPAPSIVRNCIVGGRYHALHLAPCRE